MAELSERDVDPNPLRQFDRWAAEGGADLMVLATATPDGVPSARMVLLKGAREDGLVFFTSYASRKGRELDENPRAALLFHWHALGRQVRVEGSVERIAAAESDAYFASRPARARLSAVASPQSEVVSDRAALEALVAEARERHGDAPPRPETWGGYRLVPEVWEFWQHRENRLHDRLRYSREGSAWLVERLGP
jgi:pyridoxamine 5'-phosphate oxidase